MKNFIETALDIFNKDNPNADSFELATYFFNIGKAYERNRETTKKELEKEMSKYYGD